MALHAAPRGAAHGGHMTRLIRFSGTAFTASIVMQAGTSQKSYPTGVLIT